MDRRVEGKEGGETGTHTHTHTLATHTNKHVRAQTVREREGADKHSH